MKFNEKLLMRANAVDTWVCVGLDLVLEKIPGFLRSESQPLAIFSQEIIHATKDVACAYKINLAFFESADITGWESLEVAYMGRMPRLVKPDSFPISKEY